MSRWLWASLGGVVLVAIAALLWTAGNQTNVTPPELVYSASGDSALATTLKKCAP